MKPSELLREVRARVLIPGAWVPFNNMNSHVDGCGCVLNHLWIVCDDSDAHDDSESGADEAGRLAQRAMEQSCPSGSVVDLNDHGPTRLWGVVSMLGRAIRRLEAEGR